MSLVQPTYTLHSLRKSFVEKYFFDLALTHSSYLNEHPGSRFESNERLEFLGDAIIGAVIAHESYKLFPDCSEGQLTLIRSAVVCGETLARVAKSIGLGEALKMGKGEESTGGRLRTSNLSAGLEAIVGGMFMDSGYDTTETFILELLSPELTHARENYSLNNPKILLQELAQKAYGQLPSYNTLETTTQSSQNRFNSEVILSRNIIGYGTGGRKSLAEQNAARNALSKLGYNG